MKPQVTSEAIPPLDDAFIERLKAILPGAVITESGQLESYLAEERGLFTSTARVVIVPDNTERLAEAVRLCAEHRVPMVPQGGNTGLVGGAVANQGEVVVSMRRMRAVRNIDPVNFTATVEAGCILADLQNAADAESCLFPLSLGAEGSCTVGGNIASNAGGMGVLRYGNMRELTLGLEVVLPDGRIWNGMRPLYKDNSGYSLKNLFIGSEGTLGFVTAAVVKLFPKPRHVQTAFCALPSVAAALQLLSLARRNSGDAVTAFELMSDFSLDIVCRHTDRDSPLSEPAPWFAMIELSSSRPQDNLQEIFQSTLEEAFEAELILDAVIASSLEQGYKLRQLRESTPEAQKRAGGSIKHDVSVPVSSIPTFIERASDAIAEYMPGIHFCIFGHVGDGNVHYNLTQPDDMTKEAFLAHWGAVNDIVHPLAASLGGSISAEHGIGLLKVSEIKSYRSPEEQDLLRGIKQAVDPENLMNPGKMI
ncbi:FAD-binding oxidoreductase [Modicisalibacter radicis]|uniref:FAD-binding oxidoreductase n=1 Tax=Halomonas sp. EAR18 TaxID=2518972 RepID=UPI00109CD755|nr:FAD-binding oxidoreductase [Halomonas sp. EAR18]